VIPTLPAAHFRVAPHRHKGAGHLHRQPGRVREGDDDADLLRASVPESDRRLVEEMERVRGAASPLATAAVPADDAGLALDEDQGLNENSWPHFGTTDESATPSVLEVADLIGGPSRTRTLDPLIKSPTGALRTTMQDEVRARESEGW